MAVESGTVVEAGWNNYGFGYNVVIEHSNGMRSLYAHLQKGTIMVKKGSKVTKGQRIGYMGSTGNSSGTHLHFELYDPNNYSKVINPWASYYQGNYSVTIGGNSRKANNYMYTYYSDSTSKAWVNWLDKACKKNSNGDYVFNK